MHPVQWQTFIEQFSQLSQRQRLAGITLLQDGAVQDAADALIDQTAQANLHCPACGATHVHRHGHANGTWLTLSAQLPGMALDPRHQDIRRARKLAQRGDGNLSTRDGDISKKMLSERRTRAG